MEKEYDRKSFLEEIGDKFETCMAQHDFDGAKQAILPLKEDFPDEYRNLYQEIVEAII